MEENSCFLSENLNPIFNKACTLRSFSLPVDHSIWNMWFKENFFLGKDHLREELEEKN